MVKVRICGSERWIRINSIAIVVSIFLSHIYIYEICPSDNNFLFVIGKQKN
jgi:hypothetical protein